MKASLSLCGECGDLRKLDPLIKVEHIVSCLGGRNLLVDHLSLRVRFLNDNPFVQDCRPFRHIEEGVRLLPGNDLMKLVAVGHLTFVIVLLPDLDDQIVRFLVLKSDKIELKRIGLAGVPDLEKVRLDSHAPAKNQGIEIGLIHTFLDEDRPFQEVGADVDPDLPPLVLGDGQDGLPEIISVVCDQRELKSFSIFLQPALPCFVSSLPPPGASGLPRGHREIGFTAAL